jgi:hypothetical protein
MDKSSPGGNYLMSGLRPMGFRPFDEFVYLVTFKLHISHGDIEISGIF